MLLLLLSLVVFTPRSHRRLLLLLLLLLWFSKQPRTAGHDQVCRSQLHGRTSCHCHCTGLRLLRCQLRVLAEKGSARQQQQGRRRREDGHIRAQEGWRAGRQQPPHQGPLIALQRLQAGIVRAGQLCIRAGGHIRPKPRSAARSCEPLVRAWWQQPRSARHCSSGP